MLSWFEFVLVLSDFEFVWFLSDQICLLGNLCFLAGPTFWTTCIESRFFIVRPQTRQINRFQSGMQDFAGKKACLKDQIGSDTGQVHMLRRFIILEQITWEE